jgi:hypothetical protein
VKQTFKTEGLDQFRRPLDLDHVDWTATGGDIDQQGVFTAGDSEGHFLVTASARGIAGTAAVSVGADETRAAPSQSKRLTWDGEVPAQKWSNFYMKVLTKLVSGGDLSLRVRLEAKPKDGVTPQQVDDAKAALRGLGLDDNVKVE